MSRPVAASPLIGTAMAAMAVLLLVLCLALPAAGPAMADNTLRRDGDRYAYEFRDHEGRRQRVSFRLDPAQVRRAEAMLNTFSANDLAAVVRREVVPYLQREYGDLIRVVVTPTAEGYHLGWSGRAELTWDGITADVKRITAAAEDTYYRESFLRPLGPNPLYGDDGMVVDIPRLATAFERSVRPLAEAVAAATPGGSARRRVQFLTTFLQAIPYRALTRRDPREGYGVLPPPVLLAENAGDCDTKVLAFQAVMKSLLPGVPVASILIDNHALVGVGIPPVPGDVTVPDGTITLVAVEPVGPGLHPVGHVGPESEAALRRGRFMVLDDLGATADRTAAKDRPRPAHQLSLESDGSRRTYTFTDGHGRARRLAVSLAGMDLAPPLDFDPADWGSEFAPVLQDHLERRVVADFPEVAAATASGAGSGWRYALTPDDGWYRSTLGGRVDAANAAARAYNEAVREQKTIADRYRAAADRTRQAALAERLRDLERLIAERKQAFDARKGELDAFRRDYDFQARFDTAAARAKAVAAEARDAFLRAKFIAEDDERLIPDYAGLVAEYGRRLHPLARAFAPLVVALDRRDGIDLVATFFQSIPFRHTEADTRGAAGHLVDPTLGELFGANRGDILSKALATAAVLADLYPDLGLILAERNGRGHLGVALPADRGDLTVAHQGRTYVALDPGGPSYLPPGQRRRFFDGEGPGPVRTVVLR